MRSIEAVVRIRSSSILAWLSAFFFSFFVALVVLGGCASRSAERSPLSPSSEPAQWAASFIGSPPAVVSVFRMQPGVRHNDLESTVFPRRSASDLVMVMAMTSCRQEDVYDRKLIAVLHGVPRWLDPARPYALSPTRTAPGFVFLGQMASGVRVYQPTSNESPGTRLFVLPSSTWILATGAAAPRLEWSLVTRATEPPMLAAMPGTMIDITIRADEQRRLRLRQLRGGDRVIALGHLAYLVPEARGNARMQYASKLVFRDEEAAHAAADDAVRILGDGSPSRVAAFAALFGDELPPSGYSSDAWVRIERFGATVVLRPMARH